MQVIDSGGLGLSRGRRVKKVLDDGYILIVKLRICGWMGWVWEVRERRVKD